MSAVRNGSAGAPSGLGTCSIMLITGATTCGRMADGTCIDKAAAEVAKALASIITVLGIGDARSRRDAICTPASSRRRRRPRLSRRDPTLWVKLKNEFRGLIHNQTLGLHASISVYYTIGIPTFETAPPLLRNSSYVSRRRLQRSFTPGPCLCSDSIPPSCLDPPFSLAEALARFAHFDTVTIVLMPRL